MSNWSEQIEEELTLLIKDWLKSQGRTQADLRKSLKTLSSRMPAILEVIKLEYAKGGLPNVAARLCLIEENWASDNGANTTKEPTIINTSIDPFDQLDLLIEEIREDCDN